MERKRFVPKQEAYISSVLPLEVTAWWMRGNGYAAAPYEFDDWGIDDLTAFQKKFIKAVFGTAPVHYYMERNYYRICLVSGDTTPMGAIMAKCYTEIREKEKRIEVVEIAIKINLDEKYLPSERIGHEAEIAEKVVAFRKEVEQLRCDVCAAKQQIKEILESVAE